MTAGFTGSGGGTLSTGSTGADGEIEALIVDRYLESLLERRPIDTEGVPDDLAMTARRLAGALPRFHPSFRFEEALAARLAAAGRDDGLARGAIVPFPRPATRGTFMPDRPLVGRPAVIGGVLTSAAISVAGAAYVVWRRNHGADEAMARAIRAVARARTA